MLQTNRIKTKADAKNILIAQVKRCGIASLHCYGLQNEVNEIVAVRFTEAKLVVPTFPFLLPSHKLPIRFCYFKHPFFMHFNYFFIPHSHSQGSSCYCFVSLSVPHHTTFLPETFSLPRSNEETLYVILYFLPDWMHLLRSCRLGGRRKLPSSTFLSSYPVG